MLNLSYNVSQKKIEEDLVALGVAKGDTLNIKSSLSSIGLVEGGAETLINALIAVVGDEGTIMTDSFIKCYKLPLSKSDAKKTHAFPTSLGLPPLFSGILSFQDLITSSGRESVISVSINPGAITLLLIFLDPSSSATDLEKPIIPAFEAE